MFYQHSVLARKSPLGTVWMAAHLERRIKKPQIDGIDVPSYADSIMFPEVPIALRLSGHLLLGLVRIYSRKVNYLKEDCNRMVTTIRTAFASVQDDLQFEPDPDPAEAITLPPTFNLDDLNIDDESSLINKPDNHQKAIGQITLADDDRYVDEGIKVEPSAPDMPSVMESTTRPGANYNHDDDNPIYNPSGNSPLNSNTKNEQGPPEKMCGAPQDVSPVKLILDDDPMDVDNKCSSFAGGQIPGGIPGSRTPKCSPFEDSKVDIGKKSSFGPQIPGSIPEFPASATNGDQLPDWRLQPSPSDSNRKRKFDNPTVLSNSEDPWILHAHPQLNIFTMKNLHSLLRHSWLMGYSISTWLSSSKIYMRKQIDGIELYNLVGKKRKLPLTALETWKVIMMNRNNSFFLVPLLHGMCTTIHATYERNFPRVSSPEPEAGLGNGGCQDAPPGCQPFEHSSGYGDAQPKPLPTSESQGKDDDDTLPELPRFSPSEHMSPWITDGDSAFKTPSTDIPPSDGNYPLDGQNTRDSGYMASLFPIDEDNCDQPRIPGLISTPGTGSTGLESMSAKTSTVLKNHTPSNSSDEQPRKFSLNGLLDGRTRKEAARMFFETMVLKSYDYIDVQQEEPYGDIEISVNPSLSAAKL